MPNINIIILSPHTVTQQKEEHAVYYEKWDGELSIQSRKVSKDSCTIFKLSRIKFQ